MPITAAPRFASPARPTHAGPPPSNPNWLKPPVWNIPLAAATNRPSHGTAANHPPPDIAERMRHCAANSFGKASNARAVVENGVNGVARDDVLRIMMIARSGNLADAHRMFERVRCQGDLVFRGTWLSTLVRLCPQSPMRTQWLRELNPRTRPAASPPAPAPAPAPTQAQAPAPAPAAVSRPVDAPAPVRRRTGTAHAAEPRAAAPLPPKTDTYDHLVRSRQSVREPVARRPVAESPVKRLPNVLAQRPKVPADVPSAMRTRLSQAAPPPLPPKPPGWENRIRQHP